jgi:hypothetical protein
VSCGAAGNCSTGGFYTDISYDLQAFVVSESWLLRLRLAFG